VAGKVSERLVEVGQRVKKGEILFRLDPEDMELQLRVAEADHLSAQSLQKQSAAEEARLKQLRTTGSVSQSEYDLGLSNRDVAKARVDAADRRLTLAMNQRTYCDLIADSDGLITSINAEAGQVVNVGQPVLQLMQNCELEATVSLPENFVADVPKRRATATFWSMPGVELQAELRELSPMADPVSRTYDAKFRLKEPSKALAIGMTVTIMLNNSEEDGICIPITSIAGSKNHPMVWRIDPKTGQVEPVAVEILQYRTESAIVRASFQQGDKIVSAGVQRVDANSLVRIWDPKN
jgi:RND family efflux transporter MFP subunit